MGSWIDEFDQLGHLRLQFNQSLQRELFYLNDLNDETIEIKIESKNDFAEKLSFEWEPVFIDYTSGYIDF